MNSGGTELIKNFFDLFRVDSDSLPYLDDEPKIFDALHLEVALVDINLESSLLEPLQDLPDFLPIVGEGTIGIDKDVVDIRRTELVEVLL